MQPPIKEDMDKDKLVEELRKQKIQRQKLLDELSIRRPAGNYRPTYSPNEILPNGKYRSPFQQ